MGGFLDKPITEKTISSDKNDKLKFTSCEMQGWRRYMEDTKITVLSLDGYPHLSLFAVFDGHGGDQVAKYVQKHFVSQFLKRNSLKDNQIGMALKETFIQMDLLLKSKDAVEEQIKYKSKTTGQPNVTKEDLAAGCTAIVVVISPDKIYTANAGDSRAVLFRDNKTEPMSEDHKPSLQSQKQRIINAGGTVIQGRVNGNLNLTRSLGDFSQKSVPKIPFHLQPIICLPQIREVERNGKEQFILLGCDGVWQKYEANSQPLMLIVKNQFNEKKQAKQILQKFFDDNLSKDMTPLGRDNMTAIIVEFIR